MSRPKVLSLAVYQNNLQIGWQRRGRLLDVQKLADSLGVGLPCGDSGQAGYIEVSTWDNQKHMRVMSEDFANKNPAPTGAIRYKLDDRLLLILQLSFIYQDRPTMSNILERHNRIAELLRQLGHGEVK